MVAPVCLVTGANRGLGRALARELASGGAHVVLLCRDAQRGAAARAFVAQAATGPEPELILADLADLGSVRNAAATFREGHEHLDVLVNCAAVFTSDRHVSPDGYELMFATNHLGPFLLTNELLASLQASAAGRVVTVAAPSRSHLDFDDLQNARRFRALNAFGQSNMANLLFTGKLARIGEPLGVAAFAVHPGLMRTDLMGEAPALLQRAVGAISRSPERAATKIAPMVLRPTPKSASGLLVKDGHKVRTSGFASDVGNQDLLWELSLELTARHLTARH